MQVAEVAAVEQAFSSLFMAEVEEVAAAPGVQVTPVVPAVLARRQTRPLSTLCQWLEGLRTQLVSLPAVKSTSHGTRNK